MRNPLGVIITTASYLTLLNAGDEVSVAAARLINSGSRIQALVDDLVDFSRTQLGVGINVVPAAVDLEKVFRDELDLQTAANPGRRVTLEVSGDAVGVWDRNRIHQVLGNLVTNAMKYGSAEAPVTVKLAGEAATVRFSIENHGAAIPTKFLQAMFEPLARGPHGAESGNSSDSSLGLGLYIAREIVRAHRERFQCVRDESGTIFSVELPR